MPAKTLLQNELSKLKNVEHHLDQAQNHIIQICCKSNPSLQEFIEKVENDSKNEAKKIQEELCNLQHKMKNVQEKVNSLDNSNTISSLKTELVELKECIEKFKTTSLDRQKFLQTNEKNLIEELNCYEQMYEAWSKPIEIIEVPSFSKRAMLNKIECPEVKEFDKFLQDNKGHTNGWTWDDNAMFLKIKTKYKTLPQVREKLHKVFPDKTVEEIEVHYKWHEKYCELRNNQRVALQKWRERKQLDNTTSNVKFNAGRKIKIPPVDSEQMKAKVTAWKEEKCRRQQEEIVVQEMNKQFYKKLEITKLQKNSEMKIMVENWRAIKEAEKRAIETRREEEELKTRAFKAMLANHFIREFQTQDARHIRKMQASKSAKNDASNKLPQPASKIVIPRDPQRLFKPTKTWISKLESTKAEKTIHPFKSFNSLNINSIQKLKAPEWRQ